MRIRLNKKAINIYEDLAIKAGDEFEVVRECRRGVIIDPPYIDGKLHSEHANIFESDGLFFTEDMYEVVE